MTPVTVRRITWGGMGASGEAKRSTVAVWVTRLMRGSIRAEPS